MENLPDVKNTSTLQEALLTQVKTPITRNGGESFLGYNSFSGTWTFGKDNEPLEPEDVVRLVPEALRHGWHRWADRKVTKIMSSVFVDMPAEPEAVEDAKGKHCHASEARGLMGVLELEDGDIQLSWEASTHGCRSSIDSVLSEIMSRAATEAEYLYPVVSFGSGPAYENTYKPGEMILPPRIAIVGWSNKEGDLAPDAAMKIAAPKPDFVPTPAEPDAPDDQSDLFEEEAPKRQRRKRAE